MHAKFAVIALALTSLVLAAMVLTCSCEEPGTLVSFENRTNGAIWVYKGGALVNRAGAGETLTVAESEHVWKQDLTARDENNNLIWQADITWSQPKEMGYRITVESTSPTPQPLQATPGVGG